MGALVLSYTNLKDHQRPFGYSQSLQVPNLKAGSHDRHCDASHSRLKRQ